MNELSLFSGAGGGLLGTKLLGWRTIGYVEWEPFCQEVLKARIRDGYLDAAPIFGDIQRFISDGYAAQYSGMVDLITFGAPCQPFSTAAHGNNVAQDLISSAIEIVKSVKPRWVLSENVSGAGKRFQRLCRELEDAGYRIEGQPLDAQHLGANHPRSRYWLVGHADHYGEPTSPFYDETQGMPCAPAHGFCPSWWSDNPGSLRMDDGLAHRMDRLKAIGNGQVPAVVVRAWTELSRRLANG